MIPLFRSLIELKAINNSRDQQNSNSNRNIFNVLAEDSGQRKRYIRSQEKKGIELPKIPKKTRHKWNKGKDAILKLLEDLDYNNQIQPSYDLTLLARQSKIENKDAA